MSRQQGATLQQANMLPSIGDCASGESATRVDAGMMRITYLHQYFIPPTGAGGTRSYEFARRLIASGHQVCMITSSAYLPAEYQRGDKPVARTEIAGIPSIVIHIPYSGALSFYARIWAFIKFAVLASWLAMRQPADIVFATSTPLTIAIPGICAKLWRRVPLVFEVRDLWPELPIAVGALRNPLLKMMARALERLAYNAASHIVALSPGMAAGVTAQGIPNDSVTVIPNSCDVDLFDISPDRGWAIRQRLGLHTAQPLIVYCGAFGLINGAGYLVDIAAAMQDVDPDICFLLAGTGAERTKILQRAHTTGLLNRNLHIWEPLPKRDMPDLLAAATVATSLFLPLPGMEYNSANKFFDGLAAGKPMAINYGGWQADLLREQGAGIVLPPIDPVQAARDLAEFVRDKARLQTAAAAARTLAHTQFHRDIMGRKLETILRDVINT